MLQLFGYTIQIGGAVLSLGAIAMVVLVLLLAYVLRHTAWGRHVYAVGDDPDAAGAGRREGEARAGRRLHAVGADLRASPAGC